MSKFSEKDEAYLHGRSASWREILAGLVVAVVIGLTDLVFLGVIL